jgi:MFS family permease
VGLLVTAFSLPSVFIIPITGVLADRFGRRVVIVPLLFLYGVAGTLGALATDFETLLALRFLAGLGSGSLSTLSLVLVGDHFNNKERPAVFGYRIAVGQGANGLFPLFGGALALLGWRYPFALYALALPVGLYALAALERGRSHASGGMKDYGRQVWFAIARFKTLTLLTVAPAMMVVNQGIFVTFLPLFMAETFAASPTLIGLVMSVRVIAGMTAAAQMGRLARRFGEERLVAAAFLILALATGLVPLVQSVWALALCSLLFGLSNGISFPAYQSLLIADVPSEMRGAVMSANGVTNRIGQTLGPLIAGGVYFLAGMDAVFLAGSAFLVAMAVFLGLAFRWTAASPPPLP